MNATTHNSIFNNFNFIKCFFILKIAIFNETSVNGFYRVISDHELFIVAVYSKDFYDFFTKIQKLKIHPKPPKKRNIPIYSPPFHFGPFQMILFSIKFHFASTCFSFSFMIATNLFISSFFFGIFIREDKVQKCSLTGFFFSDDSGKGLTSFKWS
jgi:hypothetical protein